MEDDLQSNLSLFEDDNLMHISFNSDKISRNIQNSDLGIMKTWADHWLIGVWTVTRFSRLSSRPSLRAYSSPRSSSRLCVLHLSKTLSNHYIDNMQNKRQ